MFQQYCKYIYYIFIHVNEFDHKEDGALYLKINGKFFIIYELRTEKFTFHTTLLQFSGNK